MRSTHNIYRQYSILKRYIYIHTRLDISHLNAVSLQDTQQNQKYEIKRNYTVLDCFKIGFWVAKMAAVASFLSTLVVTFKLETRRTVGQRERDESNSFVSSLCVSSSPLLLCAFPLAAARLEVVRQLRRLLAAAAAFVSLRLSLCTAHAADDVTLADSAHSTRDQSSRS